MLNKSNISKWVLQTILVAVIFILPGLPTALESQVWSKVLPDALLKR